MVLGLRKPDTRIRVLEFDEIHVTEDVVAVGVLVAVAFREGTRCGTVPVDEAHNWIKQRLSSSCGLSVLGIDLLRSRTHTASEF